MRSPDCASCSNFRNTANPSRKSFRRLLELARMIIQRTTLHVRPSRALHALTLLLAYPAANAADAPAAAEPAAPVQSVVVSAQKLPVETLIDRKVYNVTNDVQAS